MRPIRTRVIAVITLLAFLAAALAPLLPQQAVAAEPCTMMMDMASPLDGMQKSIPMPAAGDLSCCIVMCALPAAATPVATPFAWGGVGYWATIKPLTGVTVSPDPSPPRSRA